MNAKTPDDLLQKASEQQGKKWKDTKRYKWLLSPALPVIGIAALAVVVVVVSIMALALLLSIIVL